MRNKTELAVIARLAKLSLLAEETDAILSELKHIVDITQPITDADLTSFDTSGDDCEAASLREDIITPSPPAEVILSSAAEQHGGFFSAPR